MAIGGMFVIFSAMSVIRPLLNDNIMIITV